jgi:hypothetical protein
MKKKILPAIISAALIVFTACSGNPSIKAERQTVNAAPVKTYQEIVQSEETTDTFNVALYETKYQNKL